MEEGEGVEPAAEATEEAMVNMVTEAATATAAASEDGREVNSQAVGRSQF